MVPVSLMVSVWPAAMLAVPPDEPPPCKAPICSLAETRNVAPAELARETVPVFTIAFNPVTASVPALIVVSPE